MISGFGGHIKDTEQYCGRLCVGIFQYAFLKASNQSSFMKAGICAGEINVL